MGRAPFLRHLICRLRDGLGLCSGVACEFAARLPINVSKISNVSHNANPLMPTAGSLLTLESHSWTLVTRSGDGRTGRRSPGSAPAPVVRKNTTPVRRTLDSTPLVGVSSLLWEYRLQLYSTLRKSTPDVQNLGHDAPAFVLKPRMLLVTVPTTTSLVFSGRPALARSTTLPRTSTVTSRPPRLRTSASQ